MFEYRYPQFQSKRLLRAQMLEELRDYPLRFARMMWQDYAQGVVSGCRISWVGRKLTVGGGIIYKNKQFYFMEEPYTMDCGPLDRVRYLKVRILPEQKLPGETRGEARIVLDEKEVDEAFELELCRFRLQEGARLRDRHENFEDFSTEYDTVDFTFAPWAGKKNSILNPLLMAQFAREMLRKDNLRPEDLCFSMNVLSNGGTVAAEAVREYIRYRTGGRAAGGVRAMYEGLLGILKERADLETGPKGQGNIFLI